MERRNTETEREIVDGKRKLDKEEAKKETGERLRRRSEGKEKL